MNSIWRERKKKTTRNACHIMWHRNRIVVYERVEFINIKQIFVTKKTFLFIAKPFRMYNINVKNPLNDQPKLFKLHIRVLLFPWCYLPWSRTNWTNTNKLRHLETHAKCFRYHLKSNSQQFIGPLFVVFAVG